METICLDLAQKNIHQIGLSEFTTTTHNQKSTPNQQKFSFRFRSGMMICN